MEDFLEKFKALARLEERSEKEKEDYDKAADKRLKEHNLKGKVDEVL